MAARTLGAIAMLALAATNAAAQGWAPEVRMPVATQEVSAVSLDGLVYVAAGSLNQVRTNATWSYNPATHTWASLAPYPGTAVDHAGIATAGGLIYLIGGVSAWPEPSVSAVHRYNPATNTWTAVAPLPIARGATGVAVMNGKIYVAGGLEAGNSVADFTVYDPATNAWTTLPAMPTARDHLTGAAVNGKFYAIGGRINGQTCSPFTTVEVYDPSTNAWTTAAPMLVGHAGHASATLNGHIQVFGGEGATGNCSTIPDAEDYDPVANAWTTLPSMLTPRHGIGGAVIDTSVYIPGGGTSSGDAATPIQERFDTSIPNSTGPVPNPWTSADIGGVTAAGSATYTNGLFDVFASGADIWGSEDSFHYVYQPLNGDGQIVARVIGLAYTDQHAKAGVMIRETLAAGSRHVLLDAQPDNTTELMARMTTGGSTTFVAGGTASQPTWLKLVRSGSTFTGYVSTDGATWTPAGSTSVNMASSVFVGLAVASHSTLVTAAAIDNVAMTSSSGGDVPPAITLTSPPDGATYTAPATVTLAATASDSDGTVARVDFYANNALIGSSTDTPYGGTWSNVAAGSYTITAVATDNAGLQTTSAPAAITVTGGGGGGLPAPWTDEDIGSVGIAGSASDSGGVFTVKAAGADIWGPADSFHYVSQPFSGDGTIVAHVTSLQNTSTFAKAGVMFRGALTAGAADVILDAVPNGGIEFMTRTATGGETTFIAGVTQSIPVWLRLTRAGSTFTASASTDGATWTEVGTTSATLPTGAYVGLAVTSHDTSALTTAVFDNVAATLASSTAPGTPSSPNPANSATGVSTTQALTWTSSGATTYDVAFGSTNPPPTVSTGQATASYTPESALANSTAYYWRIVAHNSVGSTTGPVWSFTTAAASGGGLPAPWTDEDIGSVGVAGSASFSSGVFTVKGAGADIWGPADSFHYVSQPFSGDGTIVARVSSLQNTNAFAKAGVMFRGALTAGAVDVILDAVPNGSVEFMTRTASGGATTFVAGGMQPFPAWLQLSRSGSTFTASISANGTTWTQVGAISVAMATGAHVGLAVTSHNTSALTTAVFDNVAATLASSTAPGTPSSPNPSDGATNVSTTPALTWTSSGATTYDVAFGTANPPPTVSTGQASASYTPGFALANSTTYRWQIVAHNSNGSNAGPVWSFTTAAASGGGLPAPWTDEDIGSVGRAGSASYSSGVFTIKGAGADIYDSADSFNFLSQPWSGDGQIVARVNSLQNTNTFAKAGVMFRETLTAGSAHVILDVVPGGGVEFMARQATGQSTTFITSTAQSFPVWLKLTRSGSTFTGYISADGSSWTEVGTISVTMAAGAFAGVPVTSHNTSTLTTAVVDTVSVGAVTGGGTPISFASKTIVVSGQTSAGTAVAVPGFDGPTSVAFGPDGRLYVSVVSGKLFVLTLDQSKLGAPGEAPVTSVQEIDAIFLKRSIVCDSAGNNCQLQSGSTGRQVTGIAIDPQSTPGNIILYVSNSGLGRDTTDMTLYTYGGTITRLTLQPDPNSPNTLVVAGNQDLVTGLPRSREAHSVNGMSIGPDGWLYLGIGGNTNAGQPSTFFANLPEYYLSASVVRLNLGNLVGKTLPIDVSNVRSGADMSPLQGTFELFATGYRNPYDIVWHSNGRLYLNGNEANLSQGNTPGTADGCSTPSISPGDQEDSLNIVTAGAYGGHPDPARGQCVWEDGRIYSPPLPPEPNWVTPVGRYVNGSSSDGIAEYTSNAFAGQLQGNLISATYGGDHTLRRVVLTPDGSGVASITTLATFTQPLDVIVDVDGNIFVADYGANEMIVMTPATLGTCPVPNSDPKTTDSDGDGYTDYDEQVNTTDACSAASVPADADHDHVSNLLDADDDNDGIADTQDQLYLDPLNGSGTVLPVALEWNPSDPSYGKVANSGFTGVQISSSGPVDQASGHALIPAGIHPGDAGGHLTMWTYSGTAQGAANSQANALQVGFDSSAAFRVWSRLTQPFTGVTPALGHRGGIFFGPDQDNYVRLALIGTSTGGQVLQIGVEVGGTFTEQARVDLTGVTLSNLDLFLIGDPVQHTITAYYDPNATGTMTPLGVPISVPAAWFGNNTGTAANTSLAGIMGTNGAAPQMAFVYDFFRIDRNVP